METGAFRLGSTRSRKTPSRSGKLCPKVSPIAFAPGDGGYYTLGHSIGRSFDIGKTFTGGKE